jgi:hypothetical protein
LDTQISRTDDFYKTKVKTNFKTQPRFFVAVELSNLITFVRGLFCGSISKQRSIKSIKSDDQDEGFAIFGHPFVAIKNRALTGGYSR